METIIFMAIIALGFLFSAWCEWKKKKDVEDLQRKKEEEFQRARELRKEGEDFQQRVTSQIVPAHWEVTTHIRKLCDEDLYGWTNWTREHQRCYEILEQKLLDDKTGRLIANLMANDTGVLSLHYAVSDIPEHIKAHYQKMLENRVPPQYRSNILYADLRRYYREQCELFDRKMQIDTELQHADLVRRAAQNTPRCPLCRSTNIAPISMAKRVVSTELLGWASPTIGKSYECKTCGYKW